jgi:hypothetical protein
MQELRSRIIDGMKFMWDGNDYASAEEAESAMAKYSADSFETRMLEEDGTLHVYTRRVVKDVVVEGSPANGT